MAILLNKEKSFWYGAVGIVERHFVSICTLCKLLESIYGAPFARAN